MSIDDYHDWVIMPGLIDCNVNLHDKAKEYWEGFDYGTKSAAAGGVTTIVDFPTMKKPSLVDVEALKEHIEAANDKLRTDIILLAYLTEEGIDNIESFIEEGTIFGYQINMS